jgi:hypothetical protein
LSLEQTKCVQTRDTNQRRAADTDGWRLLIGEFYMETQKQQFPSRLGASFFQIRLSSA